MLFEFDIRTLPPSPSPLKVLVFKCFVYTSLSVTVLMEERNKVTSRSLIYNKLMNAGSSTLNDLSRGAFLRFFNTIAQNIDSEFNPQKICRNYPNKMYKSFKECDDKFVFEEVEKIGLMPFWATNNYTMVTKLRYFLSLLSH